MAKTAHLEVVVGSGGVMSADKALKQLTATAKETEKQQQHMAAVMAEIAAAEEKAAQKAVAASAKKAEAIERATQKAVTIAEQQAQKAAAVAERESSRQAKQIARENEQWNDATQKAIARNERRVASAEKAAKREADVWNNAIQRAKGGLDGVLPVRPSLQRIEAAQSSQIASGAKDGALSAFGMGFLGGSAAGVASVAVQKLAESVKQVTSAVVDNLVQDANMVARLGGVTNSAQDASETFEDLKRNTLGKLPSTVHEVSDAFAFLGNVGLSNSQQSLKAYSNIAAQTGRSLGDVTHAVQMATMGNYRSLREYGIKVKDVGNDLQLTFRGQTQTIGNSAEAIETYLLNLGKVEFAGAVERQMDTIGGTIKRTDDAWERLVDTIGDSSIGSLIESSFGASITFIDAATASVDALFGKIEKGHRELESLRIAREAQSKLDAEMMSWADPTASKTETARLAASLEAGAQSSADKALAVYTRNAALIDKLEMLGEERVGDMTLKQARDELYRQYSRDSGGGKTTQNKEVVLFDAQTEAQMAYERRMQEQAQRDKEDQARQLETLRQGLNKQEDAERASYEARRKFLQDYYGPDAEDLWARNSALWEKHLDDVAEKSAKKQLELQKRLAGIGIGPQSQYDTVNRKYAGQSFELGEALGENMSGKNGDVLKLEAEQTYAEKSIAIERARAKEIESINRELAMQSLQNAGAIFGGLAAAAKNAHGEQSKEYQAMFAMQQAFGLVTAEAAMYIDMAKASEAGFPANVPLYLKAAAQGAQIIAQLSSLSYSGAYDKGGGIPGGSYGDVGERGWELVRGAKVSGPAQVIGREATAAMLGASGSTRHVVIVGVEDAVKNFMGSTAGERVMTTFVKRNGALIRTVLR